MRFAVWLAFVLVCGCDDAPKRAGASLPADTPPVAKTPRAAPDAGPQAALNNGSEEVPFAKLDAIAALDEAIKFCLPLMEDTTGAASGGTDFLAIWSKDKMRCAAVAVRK